MSKPAPLTNRESKQADGIVDKDAFARRLVRCDHAITMKGITVTLHQTSDGILRSLCECAALLP